MGDQMSVGPDPEGHSGEELLRLGAGIVAAYVSRNTVSAEAVPDIIRTVHQTLEDITRGAPAVVEERPKPATPIGKSVQHDYIVCLEDGKKLKMLKRYLRTNFNMTPEEYRAKWNLPRDYPMVAPAYAEQRRGLAKQIGLGRKPAEVVKTVKTVAKKAAKSVSEGLEAARAHLGTEEAKVPAKRGRKPKAAPVESAPTEA